MIHPLFAGIAFLNMSIFPARGANHALECRPVFAKVMP
jgi:hypothetical protein